MLRVYGEGWCVEIYDPLSDQSHTDSSSVLLEGRSRPVPQWSHPSLTQLRKKCTRFRSYVT